VLADRDDVPEGDEEGTSVELALPETL
jgi:hypothetical protein